MTLLKIFLGSLLVAGCAGMKPPNARIGVVNPAGKKVTTYNLKTDFTYDDKGMRLKPSAKPVFVPVDSLWDLEGWVCMTPQDYAKTRSQIEKLISRYEQGCR